MDFVYLYLQNVSYIILNIIIYIYCSFIPNLVLAHIFTQYDIRDTYWESLQLM